MHDVNLFCTPVQFLQIGLQTLICIGTDISNNIVLTTSKTSPVYFEFCKTA